MASQEVGETHMGQATVTINGTEYDAHTGLPVKKPQTSHAPLHKIAPSTSAVHTTTQRSKTLNRRLVKPAELTLSPKKAIPSALPASPHTITRFAPRTVATPARTKPIVSDIGPRTHPLAQKAQAKQAVTKPATVSVPKSAKLIKEEAIKEALAKTPARSKKAPSKPSSAARRHYSRLIIILASCLVIVALGGYLTYVNLPVLSTHVAAAEAGINATYPSYRPDGYSLAGAVSYSQGEVKMTFKANSGTSRFVLTQAKSSWDASAVLADYINPKVGGNYVANSTQGLTIYTFNSNAAWVNAGILYTITGNAPLSGDQLQQIATSL